MASPTKTVSKAQRKEWKKQVKKWTDAGCHPVIRAQNIAFEIAFRNLKRGDSWTDIYKAFRISNLSEKGKRLLLSRLP